MSALPTTIIRLDDGQEFILDKALGTYSLKMMAKFKAAGHLVWEYTFEQLGDRTKFKIADGTEDVAGMQKAWIEKMNRIAAENRE
jgi:hypothetical protein